MERLTVEKCGELLIKYNDGEYRSPCFGCESIKKCNPEKEKCGFYKALEKLKEYECLEGQGKLRKLPCAVGDTVYAYCSVFGILAYTVDCIVIDKNITFQCSSYSNSIGDCPSECLDEIEPDISDFGKTVFLTQEAVEAALKEMSG